MPQNILEPNQVFGGEYCGGANFTELTSQGIWGWADTQCNKRSPIICRESREQQDRHPAHVPLRGTIAWQKRVQPFLLSTTAHRLPLQPQALCRT
jgi:hypothetical protein